MYAYVYKSWMYGDTMKQATPLEVQKKVEKQGWSLSKNKRSLKIEKQWQYFLKNKRELKDRDISFQRIKES